MQVVGDWGYPHCPSPRGVDEGGVLVVSVFSPAFLQALGPCRGPVIDTTSPISADIGPNLGSMITSRIRSSMDGALGSLQSLLQGTSPIRGRLAGASGGCWNREHVWIRLPGRWMPLASQPHPGANAVTLGVPLCRIFSWVPGVQLGENESLPHWQDKALSSLLSLQG